MTRPVLAGFLGVVGVVVVGAATPTAAQQGYQIQQQIDGQWQVFRTPKGNYAPVQSSDTACKLDLASAANAMPKGTILACRRPIPIQRNAQGN